MSAECPKPNVLAFNYKGTSINSPFIGLTYGDNILKLFCGLLLIVILSIAKNPYSYLKSIQRCFASLNMTFLEQSSIFSSRLVPPFIVYRGIDRVSIGYRLGMDWRKVESTEINHRIETKYGPKFDCKKSAADGGRARNGKLDFCCAYGSLCLFLFAFLVALFGSEATFQ